MIDPYLGIEKYPICDTDIWVDIVLGELDDILFQTHKKIVVADVVKNEIMRFKANEQFKHIASKFEFYREALQIIVIEHHNINEEDRMLLELQLKECVYSFSTGLCDNPHEKNKGEIVSAIYAQYYKLPFLKSNDRTFMKGNPGRLAFPDLLVKRRQDVLKDLLDSDEEIQKCNQRINDSRTFMNEGKRIYETEPASQESINKLMQKLRKH